MSSIAYSIDLELLSSKSINFINCGPFAYYYDGDIIYLSGGGSLNSPCSIGLNQNFELNSNTFSYPTVFLTKLNLNSDFSRSVPTAQKQSNTPTESSFTITPNPSKTEISIQSSTLNSEGKYIIMIEDKISKSQIIIKDYSLNTPIILNRFNSIT